MPTRPFKMKFNSLKSSLKTRAAVSFRHHRHSLANAEPLRAGGLLRGSVGALFKPVGEGGRRGHVIS